jgi:hypothetical protein
MIPKVTLHADTLSITTCQRLNANEFNVDTLTEGECCSRWMDRVGAGEWTPVEMQPT